MAVARPRRWACHLATTGCRLRGVPERYVAGADTRGRQEGRPYPWSQQATHEISGLGGGVYPRPLIMSWRALMGRGLTPPLVRLLCCLASILRTKTLMPKSID